MKEMLHKYMFFKLLELVLVFLVAFVLIKVFVRDDPDHLLYNQAVVWIVNIMMLLMVWLGLRIRGEGWDAFGLVFRRTGLKGALRFFLLSLVVFLLAITGFAVGSILMANIVGIPEGADMGGYSYLKDNIGMLLLTLTGVYVVSSFGEEVIYRAFLITRITELGLNEKTGKIVAVVLSAIIFGFAHYSWGPMGIVQTGFMGLALGFCYVYLKKRLWVLVFAHAYMDTILMIQIYLSSN